MPFDCHRSDELPLVNMEQVMVCHHVVVIRWPMSSCHLVICHRIETPHTCECNKLYDIMRMTWHNRVTTNNIIIHEFHRDASLEQNFRAAMCHVLHYSCMLWPMVCVAVRSAEQSCLQCMLECPQRRQQHGINRIDQVAILVSQVWATSQLNCVKSWSHYLHGPHCHWLQGITPNITI